MSYMTSMTSYFPYNTVEFLYVTRLYFTIKWWQNIKETKKHAVLLIKSPRTHPNAPFYEQKSKEFLGRG